MFVFFNLVVTCCKIIAADTEIFKLSVKPDIGIFKKTSASFNTASESPSVSLPKKKQDFLVTSKSYNSQSSLCGVVATIW